MCGGGGRWSVFLTPALGAFLWWGSGGRRSCFGRSEERGAVGQCVAHGRCVLGPFIGTVWQHLRHGWLFCTGADLHEALSLGKTVAGCFWWMLVLFAGRVSQCCFA